MNTPLLPTVEIETHTPATASIIWLHGLGADGNDFAGIIPELRLPTDAAIRFVFPHAPVRPVTINGGMEMRAWYDIYGIGPEFREDEMGIRNSQEQVIDLIENELQKGMAPERIILAGFSQGGAIALTTGLQYHKKLAGILALSTYCPLAEDFQHGHHKENRIENQSTAIFMAHGDDDTVIPISYAEDSYKMLRQMEYPVSWNQYNMQHAVCAKEIQDIHGWICKVLEL